MVTSFDSGDGTVYQCEECGDTFDDQDAAESHENNCFVPPRM